MPLAVPVSFSVMFASRQGAGIEVRVGVGHRVGDRPAGRIAMPRGAPIEIVGAVLSTVKVALGPAAGARLPARSEAVPAAIEIPSVPLPVMPLMVTVRVRPDPGDADACRWRSRSC